MDSWAVRLPPSVRSTNGVIDSIPENDRAILKLRAWHSPINLENVDTALKGFRAYPLTARGDLVGILVCGERRERQKYAPDEDKALSVLARSVGSTLDGLRRERRDGLKAALEDLRVGMVETREALWSGREARSPETPAK